MCGIVGFYDEKISKIEGEKVLNSMCRTLLHRGPDNLGQFISRPFFIGHTRLSVIDLNKESNQPFRIGNQIISYNGEVYNYKEISIRLRKKGHEFITKSDTEVILRAFQEWGPKCVDYFTGMWAFAIIDLNTNELFASRDRFGIKPLYFINGPKEFYFASEIKALKKCHLFSNNINQKQVLRGLQLGWNNYKDETYFSVVNQLPPAHNLIYKNGRTSITRYWDLQSFSNTGPEKNDNIDSFRSLFFESVKLHMRSDVKIGSCLSGGLDSSSITSSVGTLFPQTELDTFSIYYEEEGMDERKWVKEVIKKYSTLNPNYFSPDNSEINENFEKIAFFQEVPMAGSSPISQYFLMRLASKNGVKVTLDGQGADEYLGGYFHSYYRLIGHYLSVGKFSPFLQILKNFNSLLKENKRSWFSTIRNGFLSSFLNENQLFNLEYFYYLPFCGINRLDFDPPFKLESNNRNKFDNFLYTILNISSLPTLLHYADRNSMAFSIESRVPFLDHKLVEFAFSVPPIERIHGDKTKFLLRESLRDVLPEKIYSRRDKKGFVTPGEVKWLDGPLKHLITELDLKELPFLDQKRIRNIVQEYKQGNKKNAKLVWRLAMLNYWVKNI